MGIPSTNRASSVESTRGAARGELSQLRDAFRRRLLSSYLFLMDSTTAERSLNNAIDQELNRLHDVALAEGFAASIGFGSPAEYLSRLIDVKGLPLLCAIRFFGGDRSRPFVDIFAGDSLEADCTVAAAAAMQAYKAFRPACVRIIMPGTIAPEVDPGWRIEQDQVLAVGRPSAMAANNSASPVIVKLLAAKTDEAAEFVRAGYSRIAAADAVLRQRLFPATSEELGACADHGHLWWWTVEGERAGIIAAKRDALLGVEGLVMVEEIVAPRFAGRGTAAVAQRALAASVLTTGTDNFILGTIDAMNTPSRSTARRAGRSELLSWWFLTPPGEPARTRI